MRLFGLIGYPLTHSFSQKYFREKFEREGFESVDYQLFPTENAEDLFKIIEEYPELEGLNITIPHKQKVFRHCETLTGETFEIGAVNTIKIEKEEKRIVLHGHNTDVEGFRESFLQESVGYGKKALVLGTGGASLAVKWVLKQANFEILTVSRELKDECITYSMIDENILKDNKIIINATPCGMYPNINSFPDLPYSLINEDSFLYDLIYNPETTLFLQKGGQKGAKTLNGIKMLYAQAEASWRFWNT